jgi:HK97 family phage prohead protease
MDHRYIKATIKQEGEGYRIIATTRDIDRDGEVVEPSGVNNFDAYLENNPVILWAHDYSKPPVGRATGGEVKEDRIELDVEWAETEFGREVKYLFDNGFMSSFSIGFIPKQHKVVNGTFHWTDWELLEVSAVPVPANAMANILRSVEDAGVDMPAVKGLYRDASDHREEQEVREAAKRKHEDTWQMRLDYIKRHTRR